MKKSLVCVFGMFMLLWCSSANADMIFYDSFTRSGELVGTSPDTGGGAYVYVPSGYIDTKVGTGSRAYLAVQSQHSGSFINFSIRTTPTGLNYDYSSTFYLTATFNSSDLSQQYGGHLGVEVGVNVWKNGTKEDRILEQQIGLGQSNWYGDGGAAPHTVAWGSGSQFGRFSLGDYTLGSTVTLAMKIEEILSSGHYNFKAYAAVVPSSGLEPTWTEIAGESGKDYTYSVDYIGLTVAGINHGDLITHSGYIDEIRIGKTWNDVTPVPLPAAFWLLGSGLAGLGILRKRMK